MATIILIINYKKLKVSGLSKPKQDEQMSKENYLAAEFTCLGNQQD